MSQNIHLRSIGYNMPKSGLDGKLVYSVAVYATGGGAAQQYTEGEHISKTIAKLRLLADLLEGTVPSDFSASRGEKQP